MNKQLGNFFKGSWDKIQSDEGLERVLLCMKLQFLARRHQEYKKESDLFFMLYQYHFFAFVLSIIR